MKASDYIVALKPDLSLKDLYDRVFLILLAVDAVLRMIWLDKPAGWLILDEHWYVNAARVIIGIPSTFRRYYANATLGLDPNTAHPPLAKLLIALSIQVFGDNGFGWRFPSVCFGLAGVVVFYLLLKKAANKKIALIGTFLFSFDNLIFVQSRVAMLDIFTLTFMLLGFYWYFSGRPYLSAVGMALSTLTKLTGGAGFLVVIVVESAKFLRTPHSLGKWLRWLGKYLATYAASFLLTLAVLDYFWVAPENLSKPYIHVGSLLSSYCPKEPFISCPWQWLLNQVPIIYPVGNGITFTFAMNQAIVFLAIPTILYSGYQFVRKKSAFGLFNIAWFAATYLPYYPPVIFAHTATYIFYFLLTVPSICAAIAYAIVDRHVPRALVGVYLIVVLLSFASTFPFKTVPP